MSTFFGAVWQLSLQQRAAAQTRRGRRPHALFVVRAFGANGEVRQCGIRQRQELQQHWLNPSLFFRGKRFGYVGEPLGLC